MITLMTQVNTREPMLLLRLTTNLASLLLLFQ